MPPESRSGRGCCRDFWHCLRWLHTGRDGFFQAWDEIVGNWDELDNAA